MVAVFLGFASEIDVVVKMLGVGMAVAILLDATLVRMVLVPATMSLLGRLNWWLPAWLDRILPTIATEAPAAPGAPGAPGEPEPQAVAPIPSTYATARSGSASSAAYGQLISDDERQPAVTF